MKFVVVVLACASGGGVVYHLFNPIPKVLVILKVNLSLKRSTRSPLLYAHGCPDRIVSKKRMFLNIRLKLQNQD